MLKNLATVAKPGTIVSTVVDTSGLEPIAQTVTFSRSSMPPFFTTRVQYTTPENAARQHDFALAVDRHGILLALLAETPAIGVTP